MGALVALKHVTSCSGPQISWKSPCCRCMKEKVLRDDGWTNIQFEPLSLGRVMWSKIRSPIKIAVRHLSAVCQWSGGMFSCCLSHPRLPLLSACLSSPSSSLPHVFFFLSSVYLSAPGEFFSCFETFFLLPGKSVTPRLCAMFIKVSFVIWSCLFRGAGRIVVILSWGAESFESGGREKPS